MQVIWESLSVLFIPLKADLVSMCFWCIFLAVLFSWCYLSYRRRTVGKVVFLLMEKGCTSPETALSPEELEKGLSEKFFKSPDHLIEKVEKEGKDLFFIPEERMKKAQYYMKTASFRWWQEVLCILAIYLVLVVLYYLLPDLLVHFGIYL